MIRFSFPASPDDYLGRLSRLRWRRAFDGAGAALAGTLEVADVRAIPLPGSAETVARCAARHPEATIYPLDSAASGDLAWGPPAVSTLREIEETRPAAAAEDRGLAKAPKDFPARYVPPDGPDLAAFAVPGFRVLRVRENFGAREEILCRIPPGVRRLLDIGCGAGETAAEARRRHPDLRVEGIDRRSGAGGAPGDLDAFHAGDALAVLEALEGRGVRFDVIVAADVLEHLADPFAVLGKARLLASPGATLVVSVPNAGSAAIVGDLLAGRFDPVGAGPEDAGHLRWFTRRTLRELVEETGWSDFRCDAVPLLGDGGLAARLAGAGIAADTASLEAVQWVATARR